MKIQVKNILVIFLIFIGSTQLFGQLINEYFYTLDEDANYGDMILTQNEEIILCGTTTNRIHLLKLTPEGEMIWTKTFNWNQNVEVDEIAETIDGDFILGGMYQYHPMFFSVDASGDSVALNILPYGNENASNNISTVTSLPDGNLIYSRQINPPASPPYANLFLSDGMGNEILQLDNTGTRIEQVELIDDSTLLFAGNEFNFGAERLMIRKIMTSGNILQTNWFDLLLITGFDFNNLNSLYFSVLDYDIINENIFKANKQGEILWQVDHFSGQSCTTSDIKIHDTIVFTTGGVEINDTTRLYIAATDTSGQTKNIYFGGRYGFQEGEKIVISENMVIVSGTIAVENLNSKDLFVNTYVLDDLITSIEKPVQINPNGISIFPNPADSYINLKVPGENHSNLVTVRIFDSVGNVAYLMEENGTSGNEKNIDVSDWTPGIYIAVVYSDGSARGKVKFVVR